MSKAAQHIEEARRVYVSALGTPYEAFARRNLERAIAAVRGGPMTKREREQVVELLRCAADIADDNMIPLTRACRALGMHEVDGVWWMARDARIAVDAESLWPEQRTSLLEAALRVEQGEWPA